MGERVEGFLSSYSKTLPAKDLPNDKYGIGLSDEGNKAMNDALLEIEGLAIQDWKNKSPADDFYEISETRADDYKRVFTRMWHNMPYEDQTTLVRELENSVRIKEMFGVSFADFSEKFYLRFKADSKDFKEFEKSDPIKAASIKILALVGLFFFVRKNGTLDNHLRLQNGLGPLRLKLNVESEKNLRNFNGNLDITTKDIFIFSPRIRIEYHNYFEDELSDVFLHSRVDSRSVSLGESGFSVGMWTGFSRAISTHREPIYELGANISHSSGVGFSTRISGKTEAERLDLSIGFSPVKNVNVSGNYSLPLRNEAPADWGVAVGFSVKF